ncbi:antibiotic transporter [Streptomyces agglomeratus]|uniref:Antibiotic transporter n=1 Tax=Streptomyces agglomeratus TaxID=285458 RepID=A0A1E5PD12_9ACTN|nr:MFS transporter [Streptomyces agglomeratus]OEJ27429.1 antibiotic transporter [Streptomyces agglomeratus]OEJ38515.1 antibiotic transporter [Streptomyces agglomeratus]OEJ47101.1 antibiotic transporter [Streptomyces agglomeratus]OEJ51043.1 antibiotic transporter [Streptomyces agglomeratus]OEJ58413.1 antibiotic transporter [Streptomyces agglomeratus]
MATSEDTAAGQAPTDVRAPAWRGGFGRLWTAAVVSKFGDSLRTAAMPLLAASLTSDPVLVALVTACGYLPWLLFGLLGGAVADRVDQRRAMWAVDLVRAVLMAAFAVAVALGHASIALLIALAFALTTLQTLFDNAATALLPSLVPKAALGSANARLLTGQQIAGGFLAAPLVPVLLLAGAAVPYAADAATYVLGAVLIASLRVTAPEQAPRPAGSTLRGDIAEGLRQLWRDRVLRGICVATTLCNIGMAALIATLVLHVTGWLDAGQGGYAAAIMAYGVGSVAGGLLAARLSTRLGRVRSVFTAGAVQIGCLVAMGLVREVWVTIAAMALFGLMGLVWNTNQVTLMQERSPAAMLGRVGSAFRTLAVAGAPLGALLGGAAAATWGLNAPALLAAALFAAAIASLAALIN